MELRCCQLILVKPCYLCLLLRLTVPAWPGHISKTTDSTITYDSIANSHNDDPYISDPPGEHCFMVDLASLEDTVFKI
jgi:hypothetical protein